MTLDEAFRRVSKATPPEHQMMVSHKIDMPSALEVVTGAITGETSKDKFYQEELALAALLLWRFQTIVEAKGLVGMILSAADSNSPRDVNEAVNDAEADLSKVIDTESKEEELLAILLLAATAGANLLGINGIINSSTAAQRVLVSYGKSARYYANNYFRRIVLPKIANKVQEEMNALRRESLRTAIQNDVEGGLLNSEVYWRMTANQATGRSHHYGILRASQERGIYAYRLVAVLDRRTSALCRNLHGRMFYVSQGIDLLERLANTAPGSEGTVAPWVSVRDVEDLDDDKLSAMGVLVPPFHSHCRTTLQPLYS